MNFVEKFGNGVVALSVAVQISQDDAQAFYDREKELFGHPVLRGESILQPVVDSLDKLTTYEARKQLLRDRKATAKHRDLDRKQKRATKRHQAY